MSVGREVIANHWEVEEDEVQCVTCEYSKYDGRWCSFWQMPNDEIELFCSFWEPKKGV